MAKLGYMCDGEGYRSGGVVLGGLGVRRNRGEGEKGGPATPIFSPFEFTSPAPRAPAVGRRAGELGAEPRPWGLGWAFRGPALPDCFFHSRLKFVVSSSRQLSSRNVNLGGECSAHLSSRTWRVCSCVN